MNKPQEFNIDFSTQMVTVEYSEILYEKLSYFLGVLRALNLEVVYDQPFK